MNNIKTPAPHKTPQAHARPEVRDGANAPAHIDLHDGDATGSDSAEVFCEFAVRSPKGIGESNIESFNVGTKEQIDHIPAGPT